MTFAALRAEGIRALRRAGGRRADRGIALILVLWQLALLSIIAASLLSHSRTGTRLASNLERAAVAEALADGGVDLALVRLFGSNPPDWRPEGGPWRMTLATGEVAITIRDESGKLDVNLAPPELLARLFAALGMDAGQAQRLATAIADYRDPESVPLPGGAEDADYSAAGLPFGAKDEPLDSLEELRLVYGMTDESYRLIAPLLTVYGLPAIDAAVADPALVRLLPDLPMQASVADGGALYQGQVLAVSADAQASSGARFTRLAIIAVTGDLERPYSILEWRQLVN